MTAHTLIIPAYNEEAFLPRLLDSVDTARSRYHGGGAAVEVIVADNASTDATAAIATDRGCRVVRVERRLIAAARNGGAASARGNVLSFVDADSQIHPETFNAIDRALARKDVIAGATGVRLERWSLGIALTFLVFMPFVILTQIDTGVVFCRRADFESIGGYDDRRQFGEDVAFLWALRKLGRPQGQRLTRLTHVKAIASMRKFDRFGDWHYFTQLFRLAPLLLREPEARDEFAQRYWYSRDSR